MPQQSAGDGRELVEALPSAASEGLAVLNADDELVAAMAGRTGARVLMAEQGEATRDDMSRRAAAPRRSRP